MMDARYISIVGFALTFVSGSAMAQAPALDRDHSTSALIEFSHPYLQTIEVSGVQVVGDPGSSNGVFHMAARQEVSSKLAIVIDMPFAHYNWTETSWRYAGYHDSTYAPQYDTTTGNVSGSHAGNLYVGVETTTPASPLIWDTGLRIGWSPWGDAQYVGLFTDITQWAGFVNSSFSTYFGLRTKMDAAKKVSGSVRGGVWLFKLETGDIWLQGGTTVRARFGNWSVAPALDGVYAFSDFRPFEEHLVGQMELAVGHEGHHMRPELVGRYYLNSTWQDIASWSLGFRLGGF